jgi:hypothetical protein
MKIQLCDELLAVLHRIEPGTSPSSHVILLHTVSAKKVLGNVKIS